MTVGAKLYAPLGGVVTGSSSQKRRQKTVQLSPQGAGRVGRDA